MIIKNIFKTGVICFSVIVMSLLCSCNTDDIYDDVAGDLDHAAGRAGITEDSGMGDDDIYDYGDYDDNGVNTNEGNYDGGLRTKNDNAPLITGNGGSMNTTTYSK